MAIIPFTSFLLPSASEMPAQPANSSLLLLPAKPQLLTSVLSPWKHHLEREGSKFIHWVVGNTTGFDRFVAMAFLLSASFLVGRAFWIWGGQGWEIGREWWNERNRRLEFTQWMMQERRARRECVAVVGILRVGGEKKVARKRVSWEKECQLSDIEGQIEGLVKEEIMSEDGDGGQFVLDASLPLSFLRKSL
jgi:hypothetical protein